ncbi:hypothetical protein EFD62_03010 [Acetivibrio mesophilus]|uniref:Uncharacterized protein n=1 Tax=Acetivibrio mesophilus TaxID=2487273 RepID=A0A4Q0I775_9FIRM|nr:hypothetical protein EFD62_03010 [Acetivibrio mesophilus]
MILGKAIKLLRKMILQQLFYCQITFIIVKIELMYKVMYGIWALTFKDVSNCINRDNAGDLC